MTAKLLSNGWDRSGILVVYVCAAYDRSHHLFRVFAVTETLTRATVKLKMSGNQLHVPHCTLDLQAQGGGRAKCLNLEILQTTRTYVVIP